MKRLLIPILLITLSCSALAQKASIVVPIAQKFFIAMETGKYHEAYLMLDSSVKKIVSEEQNSAGWKKIRAKFGILKMQSKTRYEEMKPYVGVYLTCEFDSAVCDLKVVFKNNLLIAGYFFVPVVKYTLPPYADTSAIIQRPIEVKTGNYTLSGFLTLPKKGDHFPIVVLVHGSGPSDRDETIKDNKPFKDLALGLASKGIASIRYDKRTFTYGVKSAADPKLITLKDETVDDAVSALRLAQTIKEADPKKIFLIGHSLGAMAAPRIAKQTPFVAGVICMAGNSRPFEDVILDQMKYLVPMQVPKKQADSILNDIIAHIAQIKTGNFTDTSRNMLLGLSGVYWKDIRDYDQVEVAKSLSMPILFLQGEKDYQVNMKDFALWKQELAAKKNVQFISYPGLYHLFIQGDGKPTDYEKAGHISEKVITDISSWIKK